VKMDLRRDDFKRSTRAPAKLNLYLDVLGRRGDGFHDLETLMVPIRLADQVSLTRTPSSSAVAGDIDLDVHTCWPIRSPGPLPVVPTGPDNLIVKSVKLFQERSGCRFGARVELVKRIPMAAGLGGGSSDAAAALRLANRAWQVKWTDARLAELAAEVGSDIPFFLSHGAAICRGRGEQVEPLPPLAPLYFVIVKPAEALSAGQVYAAHDSLAEQKSQAARGQLDRLVNNLYRGGRHRTGRWMHNGLQAAASILSPAVEKLYRVFAEFDFIAHQLTGSGSAYFGFCRHAAHARRLASILRMRQLGLVYATRSCQ
jgi:4-diphosphocytidyl-2-C-methyl-D-erythritol kinase